MHVVIIGNGITGVTAARNIRKLSDCDITIVSAESKYFYSRPALMYIYMGHMSYEDTKPYEDWFWQKNRINLRQFYVTSIDTDSKQIIGSGEEVINYDKLIIATGSSSNKFGWPGQDIEGVQGLYNLQDLEKLEQNTSQYQVKRAIIVGGGLIGIELAEMLHSRSIPVTLLVRESSFWNNVLPAGESDLVNRHIKSHGFDLRLNTELKEILADKNGRARAVITNTGEQINCEFVGLTAGVHPNIKVAEFSNIESKKGILVNQYLETNVTDVYAAGDCAQFKNPIEGRRPIEQVWYTGKLQAEALAQTVTGNKVKYEPGYWFNSAKFLDIEYQTYGVIFPEKQDHEERLYWEDPDGKRCINLVYDKNSRAFIGLNVFGIRIRHHIMDKFLSEKRSIEYVLEHLKAANFDPEFYKSYEEALLRQYNERNPQAPIQLKKQGIMKMIFG